MILEYIYELFGNPNSEVERLLYLCLAIYLVIYLLKLVMNAVFKVIGVERRRY